jgi:hypothetical protein
MATQALKRVANDSQQLPDRCIGTSRAEFSVWEPYGTKQVTRRESEAGDPRIPQCMETTHYRLV